MNTIVVYAFLVMGLIVSLSITVFVSGFILKTFITRRDTYSQGLINNPLMIAFAIMGLLTASIFSFHGARDCSHILARYKTGGYTKGIVTEAGKVHTCDGYQMRYRLSYTTSNGISHKGAFNSAILYDIGEVVGVYYMPELPGDILIDNAENGNLRIVLLYAVSICFFSLFLWINLLAYIKARSSYLIAAGDNGAFMSPWVGSSCSSIL